MRLFVIAALSAIVASIGAANAQAPDPNPEIRNSTPSSEDKQKREAQKLFAIAVRQYRQDLLLDAIRSLEECLRLDPEATPPRKLLAAAFAAVGRIDDAIAQWEKVTASSPDDFVSWERYADQLNDVGKASAARDALKKAVGTKSIQQHVESWLLLLNRLAIWSEKQNDFASAEFALTELVHVLRDKDGTIRKAGILTQAEIVRERADALERLGDACLRNGKLTDAEAAFGEVRTLLSAAKDVGDAARIGRLHWRLAQSLEARKEFAPALDHLNAALRQRPGGVEPYRLLVRLLDELGRGQEVIPALETHAHNNDKNAGLQILLAEQYAAAGRSSSVRAIFQVLLRDTPKPDLYRLLFGHLAKARHFEMILQILDDQLTIADDRSKSEEDRNLANAHVRAIYSVLQREPAMLRGLLPLALDKQSRRQLNQAYRTFDVLGHLAARSGELPAAEKLLQDSLKYLRRDDGGACVALCEVWLAQKKYREVVEFCQQRIQSGDLNQFLFHYFQAIALGRSGDIREALAINEQAVEIGADAMKLLARKSRVEIMRSAGRYDDAVKECVALLRDYPQPKDSRDIRRMMAAVLSAKRDYINAEKELRKLYDEDPNDAGVCNDLGYYLAEQNRRLDEAEKLVRRALKLDRAAKRRGADDADEFDQDDNPAYIDSLAWVLFRKGRVADARELLEKAVTHPDARHDGTIWDHLGDVCYRLGDLKRAHEAWRHALQAAEDEQRLRKDSRYEETRRKLETLPTNK